MSVYHIPDARSSIMPERCTIDKMLIENEHFIETIAVYQSRGQIKEAIAYQKLLHKNLVFLAKLADKFKEQRICE